MNPQILNKWKKWLGDANTQGTIIHEFVFLALTRTVFSGVKTMISENPKLQKHSAFHSVFAQNHAHAVLMYIRRQVRRDSDSISLIKLADDLLKNHELVTMDYHVSLYIKESIDGVDNEVRKRWGRSAFKEHFGGTSITHLDQAIIQADINELEQVSNESCSFIDRRLAHLDKREPTNIPTYLELDLWCDVLFSKLKKFILLIEGSDYQITPSLNHDWKAIFREIWIP